MVSAGTAPPGTLNTISLLFAVKEPPIARKVTALPPQAWPNEEAVERMVRAARIVRNFMWLRRTGDDLLIHPFSPIVSNVKIRSSCLSMPLSKNLFFCLVATLAGSSQVVAQKQEQRLDVGLSVKGWLKRDGDARSPSDDPPITGSLNFAWGRKGKLSQFRNHVRFARTVSTQGVDSDSATSLEFGQDSSTKLLQTSWDLQYLRIPGRRFDALLLEAELSRDFELGSKQLKLEIQAGGAALQNMDGTSRDRGGNLYLTTGASLSYEQKIGSGIGPFDRFEASSSVEYARVMIGQRLRSESNFVNSVGFAGRIDGATRIRLRLMHQNGNNTPTFPSHSRLSLRLDLTWRVRF